MAKCIFCGRELTPVPKHSQQKFCSDTCSSRYRNGLFHLRPDLPPPPPQVKTLNDWIREAEECNLDYGTYRGLIEQGKTFAELKSRADSRHQPAHSHINKHCNY